MIILPKNSAINHSIISDTGTKISNETLSPQSNLMSSLSSNVKRLSIIDRGKVWARQLINKKQSIQSTKSTNEINLKNSYYNPTSDSSSSSSSSLLVKLTPLSPIEKKTGISRSISNVTKTTIKSNSDSTTSAAASSSLSLSLSNSSQTSPASSSPVSINKNKRISLIQVSPQNYYYYKLNNNNNNNINLNSNSNSLLEGNQNSLKSPQDENGYLIPITIIELNNKNDSQKNSSNKSDDLKLINKNLQNIRRQSSMKVESRSSKKKDTLIQLRKKSSFNCKEDCKINQNNISNMKKSSRRFSDINFSNQQHQQFLLPSTTKDKNSFNNLTNGQQLYNISERNNEDLNNSKHKQNEYTIDKSSSISTPIKSNINLSDESIIYIDSIDNIDCLAPNTDTSSFMTTSSSGGSSSSFSIERLKLKEQKNKSLKIRIDDDVINHDYHAIDDYTAKKQQHVLEPPSIPPPPLPPQPSSNITLLTNSIDTIEYTAKLKRQQKQQQQNIIDTSNCYEKSWENSTNFLIDKLLNKYSVNILNTNNSTSSFSNSSGTNSSANSNRNSTIAQTSVNNNEQILLLQTQQLLKQNLINSFKSVQQKKLSTSSSLSLSPTNTLSSTNSLFSNSTNCNNKTITASILTPPQVPPPPLPPVEQVYRRNTRKIMDDNRHLIRLSNNYDDSDKDLIVFTNENTLDSKTSSFSYSDVDNNEFEDLDEIWYQPTISRETVQNVLSALEIGAFLIRFSNSCKDCYALSIRVPYFANATGVAHYLITRNDSGYKLKGVEKEFKSLKSLVTHYSVMQEILPVTLNLNFTIKNINLIGNQYILSENHTKHIIDNLIS